MRKNVQQVYAAFRQGRSLDKGSISTDGGRIFSYSTVLVQVAETDGVDTIRFNATKYSVTTSQQQGALRELLDQDGYEVQEFDGVPQGTRYLGR